MEAYIISPWFFGYNLIFLIMFAVTTLLVSIFAYRIYKLTKQNQLKLFSTAFLAFSIGYMIQAVTHFLISSRLIELMIGFRAGRRVPPLGGITTLNNILYNSYVIFIMLGLILLIYMTLKVKNMKIMFLLFGVIFLSLIFTPGHLFLFHTLSSLLLGFIVLYYYDSYKAKKQLQKLVVLIAFVFLLLGELALIFSVQNATFFMMGRTLQLIAYLCILTNLVLIIRK